MDGGRRTENKEQEKEEGEEDCVFINFFFYGNYWCPRSMQALDLLLQYPPGDFRSKLN